MSNRCWKVNANVEGISAVYIDGRAAADGKTFAKAYAKCVVCGVVLITSIFYYFFLLFFFLSCVLMMVNTFLNNLHPHSRTYY